MAKKMTVKANIPATVPTWLAPVQVKVLPISDKYMDYAQKVLDELNNSGVRAEIVHR